MLSCPSLLNPKVARCLLTKAIPKIKSKQALTKLYLRKHLKSTTSSLCVTHKTWLSYSEISNYCNEILSERVKQCFLQFTHLDFLVNKPKGRWSTWITVTQLLTDQNRLRWSMQLYLYLVTRGEKVAEKHKINWTVKEIFPTLLCKHQCQPALFSCLCQAQGKYLYFPVNEANVHAHKHSPEQTAPQVVLVCRSAMKLYPETILEIYETEKNKH